jgi:hypothetical protein
MYPTRHVLAPRFHHVHTPAPSKKLATPSAGEPAPSTTRSHQMTPMTRSSVRPRYRFGCASESGVGWKDAGRRNVGTPPPAGGGAGGGSSRSATTGFCARERAHTAKMNRRVDARGQSRCRTARTYRVSSRWRTAHRTRPARRGMSRTARGPSMLARVWCCDAAAGVSAHHRARPEPEPALCALTRTCPPRRGDICTSV